MKPEPLNECPACGEKLLPALKGDTWFVCDNCGLTGEAEEDEQVPSKENNDPQKGTDT